jgi:ferredoxin
LQFPLIEHVREKHEKHRKIVINMTVANSKNKVRRKIIKIDEELCNGCGNCVTGCAEGALAIVDGKAKVVNEVFCDGLGACIGECPQGALEIIEREAYEFDEDAVEKHLNSIKGQSRVTEKKESVKKSVSTHQCSCLSSSPMTIETSWKESSSKEEIPSALRQWPTKLTLVNPEADYFKNEELLIVSDCSPVAYGDFHRKIMKGKPLITTCPMLSLNENNLQKIEEILKINPIKTIHLILMEVPCCQKIKLFLDPILDSIDRKITVKQSIIKRDGTILQKEKILN